jgi:phosphatidylserine/phosphatidylglycerophosphate/cardiolipin synthase-like enzyme
MTIDVTFLRDRGQEPGQAEHVAALLADFLGAARSSIRLAAYDFCLADEALAAPVRAALRERAAAGVEIHLAYYQKKEVLAPHRQGASTAPGPTEAFLHDLAQGSRIALRAVRGDDPRRPDKDHLMHHKYAIRDAHTDNAAVWTGSTNFTDEAWRLMENNIIRVASPELAAYYANDFDELWAGGEVASTGAFDVGRVAVGAAVLEVAFTPGQSGAVDRMIVAQVRAARRRVKVCAAQLSAVAILEALDEAAGRPGLAWGGVCDGPQIQQTLDNLAGHAGAAGQVELIRRVSSRLAAKASRPYRPDGRNNIMHNKVLVCDDTVVTGSYNFSHNGARNAENVLLIHEPGCADQYSAYIDELSETYGTPGH